MGSSNVLTDRNGEMVQHYEYAAFGSERFQDNTAAIEMSNRYTGQQLDEETGLYYYNARYYDPELGRFTQPDTIVPSPSNPQTLNRYTYADNSPFVYVDPSGHIVSFAIPVILAVVGGIAGGVQAGLQGGNIGAGILGGAISGLGAGFGPIGAVLGGAVSGAVTASMTGGNVGMAIAVGAVGGLVGAAAGAGVGHMVGQMTTSVVAREVAQFASSVAIGAVVGGASSAAMGGSFGEGAKWGPLVARLDTAAQRLPAL